MLSGLEKIFIALFPFSLWPLIMSKYDIIVSDDLSAPLNNFKFFIKIISNNTK